MHPVLSYIFKGFLYVIRLINTYLLHRLFLQDELVEQMNCKADGLKIRI